MENIGLLKLELITHGIRVAQDLPSPLTNPFGLVHLVLPEKTPVSVHIIPAGSPSQTPYRLFAQEGNYFLEISEPSPHQISVHWTPPLKSYQKKTSSGLPVSDILTVHGGFIAVHPSHLCRFGESGLSCRYCGSTKKLNQHPPFSKRDLIEALEIVLQEKRCDVVNLSSGHVETEDGGLERLSPWVAEIRKHVDILISLDLAPPATNEWIDKTYAVGADALYYDSAFLDKDPGIQKRHLEALHYAARIFPKGAVLSHLVIGLEPLEETQKRIDLLIERGVVPVLVYFPPSENSPLKPSWKVTPQEIKGLYAHLYEHLVKANITPHWVQQYDVVLTPLEGRFFSTESPRRYLALKNFYDTTLGRTMRFGLASLRRHLRVREVPAK